MPLRSDSVNMTGLYKEAESKEQELERNYPLVKRFATDKEKHGTEEVQIKEKYLQWKPTFLIIMEMYQSMWDEHLEMISVTKHCILLSPADAGSIQTALYRAVPRQRVLRKEEVDQMANAALAESVDTEWASPIVLVLGKESALSLVSSTIV